MKGITDENLLESGHTGYVAFAAPYQARTHARGPREVKVPVV